MCRELFFITSAVKKSGFLFLLFCAVIFYSNQTTAAQSGRVKPTPTPEQTEIKTDLPEIEKIERISALKVTGEIQYESGTHYSTYLKHTLNECVESLNDRPSRPLEVTKVGKMKLNDAKELAKKETQAYVLWMGFFVRSYSIRYEYVEYVDYAVMRPNTGKVLVFGRIKSDEFNSGTGPILQIPKLPTRIDELTQLKQGAREIAAILKRGGWLD
jgi:hypothetical protein